ncbi:MULTISPECIES: 3'-5' exonuclease [Vibrio]|uniref:3'-5' exonuclease n=1 Tax=Vibrio TaxID=662 RepID=UPI00078BB46C|nr:MULTISPECIES: 3'-5' exonuclease [Vibrio]BAU70807.1 hypothetical protein [Vibrio sp. 04Ya108]BBM67625.1 hypothetical protein VA249_42710 [Vibrio alfacsensis]BCN27107.1 hypothetical protein VYA_42990 [Vibrio alfacsensis]
MKKILLGGPGAGKTTELVKQTLEAKKSGLNCLLLSYNVRNVQAAQQRAGLNQRECRSIYSLVLAIYRNIASARHIPPRELIDEGITRHLARKALIQAKQNKFIHFSPNYKMANHLVDLTDRYIHLCNHIPTDATEVTNLMYKAGIRAQYEYELCRVLPIYIQMVRDEGAILFSEMLSVVVQTHTRYPTFIESMTCDLDLLLVDEVQDLTGLEIQFVFDLIESSSCDVLLAGDLNQCVTQYRGADTDQLLAKVEAFEKQQLTQNYRFGSHVAHFSSVFQQHSHNVNCQDNHFTQLKIIHEGFNTEIPRSKGSHALLTRTKEQSLAYQFLLEAKGDAVSVVDGQYWKQSSIFLALLGWAVVVTDYDIDKVPYLTAKAMIRAMLYFPYRSANDEVIKVLSAEDPKASIAGLTAASELGANSLGGLPYFLLKAKQQLSGDCTFSDFLEVIVQNQHFQLEVRTHTKPYSTLLHLNELMKDSIYTLEQFIGLFSALPTQSINSVEVMTMHASKGLEFNHVIMAGLHSSCFPLPTETKSEAESLFYVAMTRAINTIQFLVPKRGVSCLVSKMIEVGKIA